MLLQNPWCPGDGIDLLLGIRWEIHLPWTRGDWKSIQMSAPHHKVAADTLHRQQRVPCSPRLRSLHRLLPPALTPGQKHLVQVLLPHGPSQWSKAEMRGMPLILLTLHSPSEREFSSPWSLHQTGTRTSTHCCMRTPTAFPFCVPSFAYTQP